MPTSAVFATWVPAAELARDLLDLDHPDPLPVLLAEQGHRPQLLGLGARHLHRAHGVAELDPLVDACRSTSRTSSGVSDAPCVKSKRSLSGRTAEPAWRTWLPRRSRSAACSRWVAVWFRIVAWRVACSTSASTRAPGLGELPLGVGQRQRLVVAEPVDVGDASGAPVPPQLPRVGDLAAALGVEGALLELCEQAAVVCSRGEQARLGAQLLVADEARRRGLGRELQDGAVAVLGAVSRGGAHAGPRALLVHQLLEALVVDREPLLRRAAPWSGRTGSRRCRGA